MSEDSLGNGTPSRGGQLGRRDFLKIALGAGLVAAVEACAPSAPPAAQPTSAPAAPAAPAPTAAAPAPAAPTAAAAPKPTAAPAAAAPKPTGTLTVAINKIGNPSYVPTRLDPDSLNIAFGSFADPLLRRNQDRIPGNGGQASSWSVSPDGKSLTFNTRPGLKWHDGTDFTSADIKFTLEQIMRPDSINQDVTLWKEAIDRIETPTPNQAVIYLKKANIQLPYRLAGPGFATNLIFSKSYIEKVGDNEAAQKPMGTGPWKFVEFRPGELIRFQAVENHWRKTPAFQELIIRQVPEETTRVAMVLRGEADLVQLSTAAKKQLQSGGGNMFPDRNIYNLFVSLQGQYLPSKPTFNPKVPWAADPADKAAWDRALKVRKAMNLAVDRKTIIDKIFDGQGSPVTYLHTVPGSAFDDPSWKPYPYDPAQAKQLLAEAGYPNGFEFPMLLGEASGRPGSVEMGEAVAQYWQAIGLSPKLSKADYVATIRPGMVNRSLAGTAFTFTRPIYDEPSVGEAGGSTSTIDSMFVAESPALDDLVAKSLASQDLQERIKLGRQIGQLYLDNYLCVPVCWVDGLWGASKKIKTFARIPGVWGLYNTEYVEANS